jgi:flagellar basal-body rod protein FlgC
VAGVQVLRVEESDVEPIKRYEPGNPLADDQGYVYAPNVDPIAQMVNMISASRAYQADVEMINTGKELALATFSVGR